MTKNLPYFLVITTLIFLIIAVLSSGERSAQTMSTAQETAQESQIQEQLLRREEADLSVQPSVNTSSSRLTGEKKVLFGFEDKRLLWEIPDWCFEKDDYVAESLAVSLDAAREGDFCLQVMTAFPGGKWTAAYIETQEYFDWSPYQSISADIFLPEDAPAGLRGKFILTVGENWNWTEMSRLKKLTPGEWTTLTASLIPGSTDWRRTEVTDEFRVDVRKLGIRVESNMRPVYSGPIYIDNIRLE